MKNKTSIIIVIIIILAGILFANKIDFVSRIKNQASTIVGFNSGSGSDGGKLASGSGSGLSSGVTNYSSGVGVQNTLQIVYLGSSLNMSSVQINNLSQLQEFYSKIKPLPNYDTSIFYNDAKNWISGGSRINIYLEKNRTIESSATFNNFYVNRGFVVEGPNCKFLNEFKTKTLSFSANNGGSVSKTPKIDSMTQGMCAPLSAAYSINSVLKLAPPNGMATSTIANGKRVWNKEYLEWLMTKIIPQGGAMAPKDLVNLYKMYLSKLTVTAWVNYPESIKIWKGFLGRLASVAVIDFTKIISIYYNQKTDCSLVSYGALANGGYMGHISHISNIYIKDGKQYIEITNTLNQGGVTHDNTPTEQGKTTLIVDKDGSIKLSHHDRNVSKQERAIWDNMLNTNIFNIICITINTK